MKIMPNIKPNNKKKILVVDDDIELCATIKEVLDRAGYHTESAHSAIEAIAKVKTNTFDIVLLDLIMPGIKGIDALIDIKRALPLVKIIMITAFATIDNAIEAIKKGAVEYISKPFKTNELLTTINRVIEESRFERSLTTMDIDFTLSSLSNYIRRNIIRILHSNNTMKFMDLVRELGIDDHRKAAFHLKVLKDANLIEQDRDKLYKLTNDGSVAFNSLKIFENYLNSLK
ncbi:response regulator receiver protein [Candidatus Magnetoovum chiemensis]|nr:response regulator receiver protein [Candidatus Magnetoovum chiemensis]